MLDQLSKPTSFIPDFMDENILFTHMEDKMSDVSSEDLEEITTDVKKIPFVQNLIRESKLKFISEILTAIKMKFLRKSCATSLPPITSHYRMMPFVQ